MWSKLGQQELKEEQEATVSNATGTSTVKTQTGEPINSKGVDELRGASELSIMDHQ